MAKIVITNGTIHSDEDFNLTSGASATTRSCFRICKERDSHTRLRSLSSFRIKAHDLLNTGNVEVCGNLTVHGTCTTLNTTVTATTTAATDNFTLVSTDAGASAAPDFKLYRDSTSPANNDSLGHIKFSGKDAAGNETEYASIRGCIQTVGSGSECGAMLGNVVINGTSCDIFRVDYAGIWAVNSKNLYMSGNGQLRNYGQTLRLSTGGGAYDIQFEPNSVLKARLNPDGILFVCGKVDTPILKATSCTHYGACTSSKLTSNGDYMHHTTQYGYVQIGPGNSSYAHIQTDRSQFYFNKQLVVDTGNIISYNEDLKLSRTGNSVNAIYIGSATTTSCNPTKLFSQQGHTLPASPGSACWVKFGAACIPQHGRKLRMKIVAGNGYGTNTAANTQETTLLFQTSNASEGASGSSVCAAVHSFIEGSTKSENEAPWCFIVHEVNSSLYEFFGRFNTYTGTGSYYTIDSGPGTCWIACNSFVDPDSCTGSCLLSIPNRGTVFCTSTSTTCICGSAVMQGDICSNNGSRGYKLATDTASSGSRAFLVLDNDGSDGIGAGSDYTLIAKDGTDTRIYNQGPEHIKLCSSSCVLFCKPIQTCVIKNYGATPYMCVCSGCCLIGAIQFKDCQGCTRGYVYHDGTNNFGLLNCSGQWSLRIDGVQSSGTIHSCHQHCFLKNIGLAGGSASRVCIGGSRAIEGNSGILSLGEDFTSVCLRATCTITGGKLTVAGTCAVGILNAIQDGGTACYALNLVNSANGGGASIMFNDNPGGSQRGYLRYFHSDSCDASGVGNSFHFDSTEDSTTVRIDQTAGASGFYIGSSKMLNACVHGSVLCGTSCVKTPMLQALGGKSCFSAPAASADDWECSALHIRERGLVAANQSHDCYAPNINFHWASRVSNSLYMAANGHLKWGGYNASGCPCSYGVFWAGTLCGNTCVKSPIVCGTTCLATNVISSSGSAPSDYGALAIEGAKGGYGGVHFCGYTFMAQSNCGSGGIYNDTHNQWVLWSSANSATYLYNAGAAVLHTNANGVRVCKTSSGGYIDICPSGAWGHLITDNNCFYFNKPVIVNGGRVASYDEDLTLGRGAALTAAETIKITSGTTHICQLTKVHGCICATSNIQTAGKIHICSAHNCLHMASTCDAANYNFTIRSMYNWANSLCITNRCVPILKVCCGNGITSLWANNTERLCLHNSGAKIIGDLCVTGSVVADGMAGDTLTCAAVCTGTICFNTSCVTGLDAVYDVYVSSNPNCGGSTSYRDIVHMSVYVTTGWSGSAVTKYINHVNNFVRGAVHGSGASTVTAVPKLLVGTTGCECYAAACATCLQIQVAGGSNKHNTCVKIKRVL
jgi:hypothetical protein